jgi:hypothetical protein
VLALNGGLRLAKVIENPQHRGGIGGITSARLALYEFASARQERAPVVRLEPRPCRNREAVEVIADELLRRGPHALIIPLLDRVVEPGHASNAEEAAPGYGTASSRLTRQYQRDWRD